MRLLLALQEFRPVLYALPNFGTALMDLLINTFGTRIRSSSDHRMRDLMFTLRRPERGRGVCDEQQPTLFAGVISTTGECCPSLDIRPLKTYAATAGEGRITQTGD